MRSSEHFFTWIVQYDKYMTDMRIYSQFKPDDEGIARLLEAQRKLSDPERGRLMPKDEIHMTMIHFGKVEDVYARLRQTSEFSRETFDAAVNTLIDDMRASMNGSSFTLRHTGFERFGKNGKIIVATFETNDELNEFHGRQLEYLVTLLKNCGVPDPTAYMKNDHNFVNALTMRPHVTLKKGHEHRDLPNANMGMITFIPMNVVY